MKSRPGTWLRRLFDPERSNPRPASHRLEVEGLEDRFLLTGGYTQVNLASDIPGLARVVDPTLVNPWGLSFSPTGPFWFANNGSGVSDVLTGRAEFIALSAVVPSAGSATGSPTGTVFNDGSGFLVSENGLTAPGRFIFATADGTISAWSEVVDPSHAVLEVDQSRSGAAYTGLVLASSPGGQSFLYAANIGQGKIDVFDAEFNPVVKSGAFLDPNLPAGYSPFNIQKIAGELFVSYAQGAPGAGNGLIDVYDTQGTFLRRFAAGGPLNLPWGMTLAPADFGPFGGALLVGNMGDGTINAYDPSNGAYRGQLLDTHNVPISIPGLWGLTFGNGAEAGDADTLFFTAGLSEGQHGLFGALQSPARAGADTGGQGSYDPNAPGEPADYPVPPVRGPSLLGADSPTAALASVLLPSNDSSLALIPTLSPVQQQGPPCQASTPVSSIASVSFAGATEILQTKIATSFPVARADHTRPPGSTQTDALTLNQFLDLNSSLSRVQPGCIRSEVENGPDTMDGSSLARAENSPHDEGVPSEGSAVRPKPEWEQIVAPAESVEYAVLPAEAIPFEVSPSPSIPLIHEAEGRPNQQVERSWTTVLKAFLGVVSITVVWSCLRGRLGNSHIPAEEDRGVELKTKRLERRE
jgi:uncharacterized protein (TIGR03118 family)